MYPPFNLSMSAESHDYGMEDDYIEIVPAAIPPECIVVSLFANPLEAGMSTVISRNSFGRYSVVRQTVKARSEQTCDNCGYSGTPRKTGGFSLYRYGYSADGMHRRTNYLAGYFCSAGCCRSFHNTSLS